jgi:hypothetical protein
MILAQNIMHSEHLSVGKITVLIKRGVLFSNITYPSTTTTLEKILVFWALSGCTPLLKE